ncbi:MAG TPA: multiheme c-type cytochrome [Gammaproteobacteria bacterium]|nr:multiheme c-type cytochrome [Gammaproteobacteria bacterium]
MRTRFASLLLAACAALFASTALIAAEVPPLPADRDARFLGVDTCGSAECHGSQTPWRNATVLMRERSIWQAHDKHAQAYAALTSEAGRRIATKLGLADAGAAPECLVCHSTFVPAAQRGPKFKLEAGVGCESCHGPGSSFLRAHVQVSSKHATNLAAGMYPTTDPAARAALCLSCHQGDAKRRISHRIYGAGHPRLRFELDTYGVIQPYHFNPDADYRRRKPTASHFRLWAAGQLGAARRLLAQIADPQAARAGLFPELAQYDCHACHRAIGGDPGYRPRPGPRAGAPTLNDAPLIALRGLGAAIEPALSGRLREETRALQLAVGAPAARAAAIAALTRTLDALDGRLAARSERAGDGAAVVHALNAVVAEETPLPFTAAEATAMSLSTLLLAEHEAGRLADADYARIDHALDGVYAALGDENTYRPAALAAAVAALDRELRQ